jgi:Na+/H+ antiporter NhaD/arsenite permease-like protein
MLTLTLGSSAMVIGYILRIPFRSSPDSVGLYAITTLFVLLAVSTARESGIHAYEQARANDALFFLSLFSFNSRAPS